MPLQSFFGDDEHTAIDGPYARLMKTRKWLFISSGLSLLIVLRLYDGEALNDLIKVAELPPKIVGQGLLASLIYLLLQYSILLYQLTITYDLTLKERLTFRRADDLAKASESVTSARTAFEQNKRSAPLRGSPRSAALKNLQRRRAELRTTLENAILRRDIESGKGEGSEAWEIAHDAVHDAHAELSQIDAEIQDFNGNADADAQRMSDFSNQQASLAKTLEEATSAFRDLERQDPSQRRGYVFAERVIDIIRLSPALFTGAATAVSLSLALYRM